jgi:hypothetical protein
VPREVREAAGAVAEVGEWTMSDDNDDMCIQRCGHSWYECSFWDDLPTYRYEIVLCRTCGASWAYDYCSEKGNIEPGEARVA